jgi:hypothetical protein
LEKVGSKIEAAKGVLEIALEIGTDWPPEPGQRHGHHVETLYHNRQSLTHVADDELEPLESFEGTSHDEPNHVYGGFDVPPPTWAREHFDDDGRKTCVGRVDDRLWRWSRVQVDRNI